MTGLSSDDSIDEGMAYGFNSIIKLIEMACNLEEYLKHGCPQVDRRIVYEKWRAIWGMYGAFPSGWPQIKYNTLLSEKMRDFTRQDFKRIVKIFKLKISCKLIAHSLDETAEKHHCCIQFSCQQGRYGQDGWLGYKIPAGLQRIDPLLK